MLRRDGSTSVDEGDGAPQSFLGETTYRLFSRWRRGEEDALNQLCLRYEGVLRRFFHLRLPPGIRSVLETSDLVQETLVQTVQNLERFDYSQPRALARYFFTAARNRLCQERVSAARKPGFSALSIEPEDLRPSPLEEMVGRERLELYEQALSRLKAKDRALIFHRVELGLPFARVADDLGMSSPDAARVATGRAVRRLAEVIARLARERDTEI